MSTSVAAGHTPATWTEYEALPDKPKAEYIDEAIVVTPASIPHQAAVQWLLTAIGRAVPSQYRVLADVGWKPGADQFVPDGIVFERNHETSRFTGVPVLCVEVLSTNKSNDYVIKTARYADAGLPMYWIVDPGAHTVEVYRLDGASYSLPVEYTATDGQVPIELLDTAGTPVGTVTLDMSQLAD